MEQQEQEHGYFAEVVMEKDGQSAYHLAHRGCVNEADVIETSGTVMPDGTPVRKGATCSHCRKELEWRPP